MVDLLLRRYLWLINCLNEGGELTFEQIATRWERATANDNGSQLTKRTFYNHCQAVSKHFGVDIVCRRGRGLNLYSISNPEVFEQNALVQWAISSFSMGELLLGKTDISERILLEDIPSGEQWLQGITQALQEQREIKLSYTNFSGISSTGLVQPLCIKLFKRRWYLLAQYSSTTDRRVFALDRIEAIELQDERFAYPEDFEPRAYFQHFFGITSWGNAQPERIVLRAYRETPMYLRSLPLHHSQRELHSCDKYSDFELHLCPTYEFSQELLMHSRNIEILEPQTLRAELEGIARTMTERYSTNEATQETKDIE